MTFEIQDDNPEKNRRQGKKEPNFEVYILAVIRSSFKETQKSLDSVTNKTYVL